MVLMSLALTGLIGFQVNWILTTHKVQKQQYRERVFEATSVATDQLLNKSVLTIVRKVANDSSTEKFIFRPHLIKGNSISVDTVFSTTDGQLDTAAINKMLEGNIRNVEVTTIKGNSPTWTQEIDVTFVNDSLSVNREVSKTSEHHEVQKIEIETDSVIAVNSFNGGTLKIKGLPEDQNLEQQGLIFKKYLAQALKDENISDAFDFGFFGNTSQTFLFVTDSLAMLQPTHEQLLRHFYLPGKGKMELRVQMANLDFLAWKEMWLNLLISVLLVGITAYGYGYALQTILRQKKLSEMKTDFINNMTHEFKTPISTVSLALEALLKFGMGNDKAKTEQYLAIARNENARLGLMVEKVLKIAASERKDIKLNYETLDLHELILQVGQNIGMQLQERHGQLITELNAATARVEADRVHMGNVIYNLLDNAIKYSEQAPQIKISTSSHVNGIQFSVHDNGIGIPKPHLKSIFERFYRVPTGNLHNVKGFGLGLSYVSLIVEKHHGNIEVDSEPGKGSVFSVFVPFNRMAS